MENEQINLRIHHFFDIIRAFGRGENNIVPHPYQHSFHEIATIIKNNPELKIKNVVKCDSVCEGCVHYKNDHCDDGIDYRKDFVSKEEFNNQIDKRIIEKCLIKEGEILTPFQLCEKAKLYLDNMEFIYSGNDSCHTEQRKNDVSKGLKFYLELHKEKLNSE